MNTKKSPEPEIFGTGTPLKCSKYNGRSQKGHRLEEQMGNYSFQLKNPEPEGIYPNMLQEGTGLLAHKIFMVLRASIALRYVAKAWRAITVSPFLEEVNRMERRH
ncbi:hypothetical protein JTB14_036580 [Gonioctena quinquepunctata]|nr:hypothetical protein JTB14_036580 [Gonioctena quinquepunctata]